MKIQDPEHIFDAEEFARSIEKTAMPAFMSNKLDDLIDLETERDMERCLSGKDNMLDDDLLIDNDDDIGEDAESDELYPGTRIPNEIFINSLNMGNIPDPDFMLKKLEQDLEDGNLTGAWHAIAPIYGTDAADRFLETGKLDFLE